MTTAGDGPRLTRHLGLAGATVVGLAAMLGTGVFAVWTPALTLSGPWLLLALAVASACAAVNAVSAVRLASQHPESGGAYAYARIRLGRAPAVLAGWAFVLGKSASAAAAGLTIGVYLLPEYAQAVAWIAIGICLVLDLLGLRRSIAVSGALVGAVILILVFVCLMSVFNNFGTGSLAPSAAATYENGHAVSPMDLLAAAGLIFLAFAGYARITVLGEEVRDPARTIPLAVALSLTVIMGIYVGVAATLLLAQRSGVSFGTAPLENLLPPSWTWVVAVGAVFAAGASLLALLAGVGRTTFAMARRGDAPHALSVVQAGVPRRAEVLAAALAALAVTAGSLPGAIALSSTCVLIYYAVMHLTACTLPGRIMLRWIVPITGLALCSALVLALVLQLLLPV